MATYATTVPTSLADQLVTLTNLNSSVQNNVTGASTGKIWEIEGDATTSGGIPIYVKIADASSATVGSTRPDLTLYFPPNEVSCYVFAEGHAYSSGVSLWAGTLPDDLVSTQLPTGFTLKIVAS
jgi:hypothetical protein